MIEVGEYVRLKDGRIRQFKQYINEEVVELTRPYSICKEKDMVKHSKNIIELIEVNDYVNGNIVTDKYLFAGEKSVIETEGNDTNCKCLCEKDIKTILTHEQYMQNCYKIAEQSSNIN